MQEFSYLYEALSSNQGLLIILRNISENLVFYL